jgi:Family of unknown function (DUF5678)
MDNLQKGIVDERRGQFIKSGATSAGSTGFLGFMVGSCAGSVSQGFYSGDLLQPRPVENMQPTADWHRISGQFRFTERNPFAIRPVENMQSGAIDMHSVAITASEQVRVTDPVVVSIARTRELEWRRTHPEILQRFEKEWVVLEGEEIIAHGDNPVQVIDEARSKGVRTPYIFFVEPQSEDFASIGL